MDGFAQPLRRALEDLDDAGLALMLLRPTVAADAVRDGVARAKGVLRNELGVYMAAWEAIGRAGGTDVERRFLLKLAGLLPSAASPSRPRSPRSAPWTLLRVCRCGWIGCAGSAPTLSRGRTCRPSANWTTRS